MTISSAQGIRIIVLVLGAIGCGFHSTAGENGMNGPFDAALIDTNFVDTGPCMSWPALNIAPCNEALGGRGPVNIATGSYHFDTDNGMLVDLIRSVALPGAVVSQTNLGPMVRVVNASVLTIDAGATVTVTGSHPVLFVVHGDARIDGIIDASAQVDGVGQRAAGPGGNDDSQCVKATGQDGKDALAAGGAGGAGGGAYGTNGGNGGNGNGVGHGDHGNQGQQISDATIVPLRGGCRGGTGGKEAVGVGGHGGQPGDGGGAIEITALGQITISGTIRAGGSGGGVGGAGLALVNAGGGGGGSGGAIVIDGEMSTVTAMGKLCANGGGGGEGGQATMTSSPGLAATCTTTPAPGGAMQADGGDGGAGGAMLGDGANGMDGKNGAAGGGGGGSVGRIRVQGRSQKQIGGLVSPPATP